MNKAVRTNFYDAWIKFRKSGEYKSCWEAMKEKGHRQRYANNILHAAFSAGWGNKKIIHTNQTT